MSTQFSMQKAINSFKNQLNKPFNLKGIFFDMDGVLYNSMPLHAKSWTQTFREFEIELTEEEPYMNEGSTAFFTARKIFKKYLNKETSDETCEMIKNRKHEIMGQMPQADVMQPMPKLLSTITANNIDCWVVTGSAQKRLINRLINEFHGSLQIDKMVTALDVKHGKPNPEPYLIAMKKSGYDTSCSLVVENAPLGIQSAKAAGLFTIAVNTGPLSESILKNAGADIVLPGTNELKQYWNEIKNALNA